MMKIYITLLFLYPLLGISATNTLYKNNETVIFWNPPSGGMMITESNVTRKVDFLYGRNYIKELIRLGWSNTNISTNNIEVKTNSSLIKTFVPFSTQQWITIRENHSIFCLIQIQNGPIIKVILEGEVPQTFYKDIVDFSKKIALRENERLRLERWSNNLDYRNGQVLVGAGGTPDFVNNVINMRRQLNAEISNFNVQMKKFEKYCELLDREIQTANARPEFHHPKQVKAYFTGQKQDDIPVWKIIR